LQAVFGQMADETLLASQRVRPARLLAEGYAFQHPGLAAALRDMLGVNRAATHFPS
jgi:NAD dependent epimerase/dehydratase family enzyme